MNKKTPLPYGERGFSGLYRTVAELILAERVGFEPTVVLPLRLISSQAKFIFHNVDYRG